MRKETVEIYSDATNAAVMRYPGRRFPGLLLQGDSLHIVCTAIDHICLDAQSKLDPEVYEELDDLRNQFRSLLNHYKAVLKDHGIELPFNEA